MKDRIKQIRKEAGLTQEKFAERLGLKRNTVATYETGKSKPMDNIVKSICREFGINEEWLLTGKEPMRNQPKDEVAIIVSELIEENNPFYDFIIGIMKTYNELDIKSQEVLTNFAKELSKNMKKEG